MKKVIVLISLLIMTSVLAYSHSLGLGLYIPLGGSIPSLYQNDNLNPASSLSPKSAFEMGVIFQPRVNFKMSAISYNYISLGVDFGWYRDTFKFQTSTKNFTHQFDSIMTGINLEWRPLIFQLGIGGGVKFPLSGAYLENNNGTKLSGGDLYSRFNNTIIPYVRLYTGINLVVLSLSFYVNFDIPYYQIKDNLALLGEGYKYSGKLASVDIGAQIGVHLDIFEFGDNGI
ncbi:hypothetical protein A966_09536 [Brachyspira hampsonii 30446]|uniref:Serpentine_recp domain containing protein n=2 Tax=Brachyspira hampsonii TaxID=1287055 RepID=A0A2U4EUY5_9SPIR|nr:hypothetical protein [Brachyspira hampsonii]EKV56546.1 hypothetical protein A966_09536 [Brachyspira hampsonii 30446]OEJ18197.1 hypothetical protein A9495_06235 [Brachyspira hampsonii]